MNYEEQSVECNLKFEDDDIVNTASNENYADVIIEEIELQEKNTTIIDNNDDRLLLEESTPRSKTTI